MPDRLAGFVGLQVALGHVGHVLGTIDEYPIPGFILWRAADSDLLVPRLAAIVFSIDIDDYTAIVELEVVYDLSDSKTGL